MQYFDHPKSFLVSVLTLLIAVSVATSPARAAKDWNLIEETDLILQTPVCRATTAVAKSTQPVELSVSFPKDFSALPIVYVKISGLSSKTPFALIRFDKKVYQPLFLLKPGQTPEEPDIYWYPPIAQTKLLDLIKAASSIDIAFDTKSAQPIPVRFSLSGSSATLDQAEKCLKTRDLLPTEFLKVLNTEAPIAGQLPANVNAEELLRIVQQAYRDYTSGRTHSAALAQLRKAMKPLTDKEAVAQKDLNSKQARLDSTTTELNKRLLETATLEQQLNQSNTDLSRLQSEKTMADQDLVAKKAIYDPAKAQIAPYEKEVDTRERVLRSARHALNEMREYISDSETRISQLRSEASSLRSEISSLESSIRSADSDLRRAESELSSYNVSWEKRKALSSDWRYSRLEREIPAKRQEAQNLRGDVWRAQSELQNAQNELNNCRVQPNPNCGSQESNVNQAQSKLNDLTWRMNSAESDVSRMEREKQSIEWEIDRRIDGIYNDLRSKRDDASEKYTRLVNQKEQSESRLRTIEGSEIPSLQRSIADARAQIPGLERQKAQAQKELDAAIAQLNTIKQQIGFDAIEKNYFDARDLVKTLAKAIEDKNSEIAKITRALAKLRPVVQKLQQEAQKQTTIRDASQAQLTVIQNQLAPQRQQEAVLQAQLDKAKQALAEGRGVYQAVYDELAKGI